MKNLDWQHVVLGAVGIGCATAVVLLGHGGLLVQVLASVGGLSGVIALLKGSPLAAEPARAKNEESKP